MNKKNKVLNGFLIILNCVITYFISSNRWVNRMPNPESSYSFFEDLYDLFLGRGLPTLIAAIITILISFVINKLFVKQEMKLKSYIGLFCIIFIINIIVYRLGIGVAV